MLLPFMELKVHYRVHNSPPLGLSWGSWTQSVLSHYFFNKYFNSILSADFFKWSRNITFSDQNSVYISCVLHAPLVLVLCLFDDNHNSIYWRIKMISSLLRLSYCYCILQCTNLCGLEGVRVMDRHLEGRKYRREERLLDLCVWEVQAVAALPNW